MTDGEIEFLGAGEAWTAWPTDVRQNAVAIIEITRREWLSRGNASLAPDETDVDHARFAQPLFSLALDAQSGRS